ncbi:rho GTPase-activating protein [Mortierella sp. AD011]|nr:rho GTPase-activating protein [Mortierella sp. AD010]KAF9400874.1 rho GTPase-activating protein [Mortierella sp. AD011]
MTGHAKKEASTKNPSSFANLRNVMTGQSESTPRKIASHEGFQKTSQASNASSNSGGSGSGSAIIGPLSAADSSPTKGSGSNNIGSGVSAFSYLKAKLFGSSADTSTAITSSAKDLLSKKSNDMNKGASFEPSFGGNLVSGTAILSENAQALDTTTHNSNNSVISVVSSQDQPRSPSVAQHPPNTHRFFSRTLPNRRQPQQETPQLTSGKQINHSSTDPSLSSISGEMSPSNAASPNSLNIPSSSSGAQRIDQNRNRSSALSQSNTQKHLSTSSLIYQEGYLNKKVELHSGETGHGWKIYKVALKSSKLYFYKPLATDERPKFQDPKDHNRRRSQQHYHYLSPNYAYRDQQGYHHQQHSSSSGIISPRLSITNECGMVLSAFNFESSTRTLLFEGNAKSISQGGQAFAPPITKYVYGECFTEIDRLSMQLKKHVALLLFEDSVVICKRKWIRYTSTKVKDVIKFNSNSHDKSEAQDTVSGRRQGSLSGISYKSGDSRRSDGEYQSRNSFDQPDKQRGYFTKWKHEATYPLSQVEALDMASPVPSSSATFYPFAAPATATATTLIGRNHRDSLAPSIYTGAPSHNTHQTTSTLELTITTHIDGKDYTHRLLYLPPSPEVRHQWYTKFNRVKELYQSRSRSASNGRGSVESLALRDTLSPRPANSNHSNVSLHSPTSPKFFAETEGFVLNSRKMDRARAFCEITRHPELTVQLEETTGAEQLVGASINGFIHELVFNNISRTDSNLISIFAASYPLFTTVSHVLKELKRCVTVQSSSSTEKDLESTVNRVELLVHEMVRRLNIPSTDTTMLEQLRTFTNDVLQEKLNSTAAPDILRDINAALNEDHSSVKPTGDAKVPSTPSDEASVDLSNVLITGLTPALFLRLEPSYFSRQVFRYHCDQLQIVSSVSTLLNSPAFFLRQYPTVGTIQPRQSSLVFSMYSPHFLTVLITHHILIATQSVQSTSRRPKLLVHWIRTAQHSRAFGDLAGFVAIANGICSPGIIRLKDTWKQVPLDLREEVAQIWVPLLIEMDMITEDLQELAISSFDLKPSLDNAINSPITGSSPVVPCVSNIKQSIDQLDRAMPSFLQSDPVPILNIEKLERICAILKKAAESLPESIQGPKVVSPSPFNSHLQQYFGHLASISQTLNDQYHSSELSNDAFASSLACEPHFNGQYLDYHYKNRKMTGSFIPLMFPEAIPEKRLFPQPLLLSLENYGNTIRKNSFDEDQSPKPNTMRPGFQKQTSGFSAATQVSAEWANSSVTHHGTQSVITGTSASPGPRQRTYSFPPARSAARGTSAGSLKMVNMINPHLNAVACECLSNTDDSESSEIIAAMRSVAGIGYSAITVGHSGLVLKAKEENIATLMKGLILEDDSNPALDHHRTSTNRDSNAGVKSNRSSRSVIGGPRPVMVKAGTLEVLIHVVVMGIEDRSGKYLNEKGDMIAWTSRQLALDQESFMKAFFATFRSFCTPSHLLDQLLAMFTIAQGVESKSTSIPSALDLFSETKELSSRATKTESVNQDSPVLDWKRLIAIQLGVLKAVEYWLQTHASDFLDDLQLKSKLSDSLRLMSTQIESQSQLAGDTFASETKALCEKLLEVKRFTVQQLMRPLNAADLGSDTIDTFFGSHPSTAPQMDDLWTSDQILDHLNTAVWAHFLSVREQEWFTLFEVLESQSADPLGWYPQKPSTIPTDEDTLITGIHNTLYTIQRHGAPGTHWNGERLMNSLPLCLQNLCKLHHVIRGWVISQIASPNITYNVRLGRIQKMLDVILQSRRSMKRFGYDAAKSPQTKPSEPSHSAAIGVPSYVENAIVSALISPESRAYTRVWIELASGRGSSVETLEDVLALHREREDLSLDSSKLTTTQELVPAIGWLIERMLETCCYVRDMSYESPLLVNFDKRQYVYDLVQIYTKRQEQLRVIKKTATPLSSWLGLSTGPSSDLMMKLVREAAQREAAGQRSVSTGQPNSAGTISAKAMRPIRIFSRLVAMQQEKVKRDQKEFEKLEKQIKDTQSRIQKAQQEQAKSLEKQIKLEQSRSKVKNQLLKSTLMRAMRPISLAITNSWSSATTTTVSNATALGSAVSGRIMGGMAANGPVDTLESSSQVGMGAHEIHAQSRANSMTGSIFSPKPVLVINLINSTCSVAYTYTKRDFVFKIVTEEGGQSLLQALDYEDMLKWIKILNEAAAEATAKRRTLLDSDEMGTSSAPQAEELPEVVKDERKGRNSVFGVELRHLMSDGNIPLIVEKCITEIEKRGLEEVGIYRVPGSISAINKLRIHFNSGSENVDLDSDEWKDINVVAGALKQFLRELPEAVMTSALYDSLIAASALEDYDERLLTMKDLIRNLPPNNYILLKRIIEHLERVTDYEEINHMYATNLAIVFGPTLLRPGGTSAGSFATSMKNLGHQQNIVRNLILQYHWLFDVEEEEGGEEVVVEEEEGEEEEEEDEGLGEFPEITEDSDEDEYEGDENEEHEDDNVLVLAESQPVIGADVKEVDKDQEKAANRRKTIVFA